ncbi:MAG: endonuclease/exonuclease/phosphatase family protein [FCB group bacterium]|jgi:endonuclease/exonuclease/phosphatase family metal-dependent hydrolase|nr:endonuclease/exonuclease/phosphatase family protein [FCB group bacterium]
MKAFVQYLTIAVSLGVFACAPHSFAADTLRVITFNVKVDFEEEPGIPTWDERKPLALQALKEAKPDLLGLQECSPNQLAFFRESFPNFADIGELKLTDEDQAYFFTTFPILKQIGFTSYTDDILMYDKERFELVDHGYSWLSPTPEKPSTGFGNAFPRMMIWATLRDTTSGFEFLASVTHFDNSMPAQVEMARLSHEILAPYADKGLPMLFLGDFNTDYERGDYAKLTSSGWKDSYLVSPKASENGLDNNVVTMTNNRRIDHIFYHGAAFTPLEWRRLDSPDPAQPQISDHWPVLAVFEVGKP